MEEERLIRGARSIFALRIACARSSFTKAPIRPALYRVLMVRVFTAAIFLSCFIISASAQAPSPQGAAPQTGTPAAKKSAPRTKAGPRPGAESGPCQIGVIPIAGNLFLVGNFGLVTFADTYARVAADGWALDDLVVSRVRAAAPGMSVRRIPFTKEELRNAPRQKSISLFRSSATDIKSLLSISHPGSTANATSSSIGMAAATIGNSASVSRVTGSADQCIFSP